MTTDNIRYCKKQKPMSLIKQLFELRSTHNEEDFIPKINQGLGERFHASLTKNLDLIHQVEPTNEFLETCGSVLERSLNLASLLTSKGVKKGHVVGIWSKSHSNQTIAILGTLFCGAIVAPIEIADRLEDNLETMIKLDPKLIFCDSRSFAFITRTNKLCHMDAEIIDFSKCPHYFMKQYYAKESGKYEVVKIAKPKKTCAFIIPTQGTTAPKKLVKVSHYAVMYQLNCIKKLLFKDVETIISLLPLSYYMQMLFVCLSFDTKMTRILTTTSTERHIFKLIHDFAVDSVLLSPYAAMKFCTNTAVHDYNISSLKTVLVGGSPIGLELVTELFNVLHDIKLHVWYLTAETGLISSVQIKDANDYLRNVVNCGILHPGVKAKVIDIQSQIPIECCKFGLIFIQSPTMMLDYQYESTVNLDEGFFNTGDVGFYSSTGFLYIRGRIDEMIVRSDEDIFCAIEIEDVILKNPLVQDVVVILKDDTIIACVVKVDDAQGLSTDRLMKYIKDRGHKKRIPDEIKFFDSFPKTTIGTVQKYLMIDKPISALHLAF